MEFPELTIRLPEWVEPFLNARPPYGPDMEDRMRLVIDLSRENVRRDLGGPFSAAIFDSSGNLVAPGVNRVTASNCSILHAEIIAISLAQQRLGRYDISDGGRFSFDLFSSTQPCVMCWGAIWWSGIRRLVCGARSEDARAVGFDEGPVPANWIKALNDRRITVIRDVCRNEAVEVHRQYVASGGPLYNAG